MASIRLGTRKIQLTRGSSYLNLPSIWIKNCHLQKGDAVSIVLLEDGTLKINPSGGDD
jgi:antitoxin component of MazEF toxin-antitoxin module